MAPARGQGPGRRQHPRGRIPHPRPQTARRPPYAPFWPRARRGEPSRCSPLTESATRPTRQCWPACGGYTPRQRAQSWRPPARGPPRSHTLVGIRPAPRNGGSGSVVPPGKRGGAFGTAPRAPAGLPHSADCAAKAGLQEARLTLVTTVSAGRLHPQAAPLLCAARHIPLRQKDWGVRPTAVGDTLRRLVAKWLLATYQGRGATTALAPLQTAFAKGSPCEVVAMRMQAQVDALHGSTCWLLLQVDLRNALTPSTGRPSWAPWNSGARQCSRGSDKRPSRHPCW